MNLASSEQFSRAFIERLKELRLAKGMTQRALAEAAGVSRGYVTHMEAGIRNPTLIVSHSLARALGIKFWVEIKAIEEGRPIRPKLGKSPKKPTK